MATLKNIINSADKRACLEHAALSAVKVMSTQAVFMIISHFTLNSRSKRFNVVLNKTTCGAVLDACSTLDEQVVISTLYKYIVQKLRSGFKLIIKSKQSRYGRVYELTLTVM